MHVEVAGEDDEEGVHIVDGCTLLHNTGACRVLPVPHDLAHILQQVVGELRKEGVASHELLQPHDFQLVAVLRALREAFSRRHRREAQRLHGVGLNELLHELLRGHDQELHVCPGLHDVVPPRPFAVDEVVHPAVILLAILTLHDAAHLRGQCCTPLAQRCVVR